MQNFRTLKQEAEASANKSNKRVWQKPELYSLSISQTKNGILGGGNDSTTVGWSATS